MSHTARLRIREDRALALDVILGEATIECGGGGGIGRRRGLKIPCPKGRVGSTPTRPTWGFGRGTHVNPIM